MGSHDKEASKIKMEDKSGNNKMVEVIVRRSVSNLE